jgi:hypothetical protein
LTKSDYHENIVWRIKGGGIVPSELRIRPGERKITSETDCCSLPAVINFQSEQIREMSIMISARRGVAIRGFATIISVLLLLFFVAGCSTFSQKKSSPGDEMQQPEGPMPVYHHFTDVLIPGELSIVDDATMVVQTPGVASGILTLKGRVEKTSLVSFFNTNMAKDNWDSVSKIKSPASTILLYRKNSRWCVITIRDENFTTIVEIGVAATNGRAAVDYE